jgi:hypothetical protein
MTLRPVPDTVESLRVAFQKLDHLAGPAAYESAFAHARQTLLLRLVDAEAELAIIESMGLAIPENPLTPETDASRSALSLAEIEALEESSEEIPLYKLN